MQFDCVQQRSYWQLFACSMRAVLSFSCCTQLSCGCCIHPAPEHDPSAHGLGLPCNPTAHAAAVSRETVSVVSLLPLLESSKKELLWQGRRDQVEAEEQEKV